MAADTMHDPILELSDVTISAGFKKGTVWQPIVHKLNLAVYQGEMVGLVGESGSGKSVTAAALLGLLPESLHVKEGHIRLKGTDLCRIGQEERRRIRGCVISYMFQNYQGSFTPFLTIGRQMVEAIRSHTDVNKKMARALAMEWLDKVQLPAERVFASYSFQLSGGQLQRASLAAALMLRPALLIADEPTTALDVLTGEHVLDLLESLRKETGTAVLLITHDLKHVLKRTDRMAVMYGGRLVETGPTGCVSGKPQHPYTRLLLQARPVLDAGEPARRLAAIPGEPGAVSAGGCPFAERCPDRRAECETVPMPQERSPNHYVSCHVQERKEEMSNGTNPASSEPAQVVLA